MLITCSTLQPPETHKHTRVADIIMLCFLMSVVFLNVCSLTAVPNDISVTHSLLFILGGLIALCKPYGIAQSRFTKSNEAGTMAWGGVPKGTPCLEDVMPMLQEIYKVNHLEIIKSAER